MVRIAIVFILAGCGRRAFDELGCIRSFTAYGDQVCALRSDGAVYCWGANSVGNLGDGTNIDRPVPGPAMISDVVELGSGESNACAIRRDGTLWCWGGGSSGRIGDGMNVDRPIPTHVELPADAARVLGAQTHLCAVLVDGGTMCWGTNNFGQFGYGPPPMITSVPVGASLDGNLQISLGDDVSCIVRPDRSVACIGDNTAGGLGDGTTTSRSYQMRVASITDPVIDVAAGCHRHACAVTDKGDVWCWGDNGDGQVGKPPGVPAYETVPVRIAGVTGAVDVAVGVAHSCARTRSHEVWCWGDNSNGELGNATFAPSVTPVRVEGLAGGLVDLQLSCSASFVLRSDRTLVGWGAGFINGAGDGTDRATAAEVDVPCP